jgi:uncharacterized iron-regulated membrane protein
MIKRILSLIFILAAFVSPAQNPEMADTFRTEGKIYVVIAVLAIVFLSIAGMLIYIERRLSKLEKELKEDKA